MNYKKIINIRGRVDKKAEVGGQKAEVQMKTGDCNEIGQKSRGLGKWFE